MRPGENATIAGYVLTLRDVSTVNGPNYEAERATFALNSGGAFLSAITAERRFYGVQQQQTTQTGIRTNLISNVYVVLGDPDGAGGWTVRLNYHPMAPWMWIGGVMMALGGFVSLGDRRLRVGAPVRFQQSALVGGAA